MALNNEVNRSVYSESPDQNPETCFTFCRALCRLSYALMRGIEASSAMTLWLKNGCDIDDATFARRMGICATCTSALIYAFVACAATARGSF
ncbi:MAG: hypothetical protein ACLS6G_09170 [Christensenellales bacterium]